MMKNIFSLLLVLAICLTFCSCGSNARVNSAAAPAAQTETAPQKEQAAVPTVATVTPATNNAGEPVSAVPPVEVAVPSDTAAPEAPAVPEAQPKTEKVTVQITLDNYQDYFEWVDSYTDEFDSSGAYKARTQKHSFAVRDELLLAEDAVNEVTVSYTGRSAYRCGSGISFDFENMTFSGSPSMNDSYEEGGNPSVTGLTPGQSVFDTYKVFIVDPVGGNVVIDSYDLQILSISGTLTVYQ